jgi:hypothetical protein
MVPMTALGTRSRGRISEGRQNGRRLLHFARRQTRTLRSLARRWPLLASVLLAILCPLADPSAATTARAEDAPSQLHTPKAGAPISYEGTEADRAAADQNLGKGETLRAGEREHDGFFLRMAGGPGAARTRYDERVDGTHVSDVTTRGLTGIVEIAAGGRLVDNLIVHGNLIYTRYSSPTRLVDDVEDAAVPVSATGLMLGAGTTYYFMPYNVFLTGALGLAWQIESRKGGDIAGDTGFFFSLSAGKEWWVGHGNWGLGAALRGTFAVGSVDVFGVRSTSRLGNLGIAFCTTFN